MRILGAIVQPFVVPVFDTGHDVLSRRRVTFQFIRGDYSWRGTLTFEQFLEQALRCFLIAA